MFILKLKNKKLVVIMVLVKKLSTQLARMKPRLKFLFKIIKCIINF